VLKRNQDLTVSEAPATATMERYRLFTAYQNSRHGDSDMARMAMADFTAMLDEGRADTSLFDARDANGTLVGCMLTDRLTDGFSAVYSFFDAGQVERSLGTYMILSLIDRARIEKLPHVYLGYWIAQSRKMAYKARFSPLEGLGPDGWRRLQDMSG
jgi:arginine-tRNA-protein transferase